MLRRHLNMLTADPLKRGCLVMRSVLLTNTFFFDRAAIEMQLARIDQNNAREGARGLSGAPLPAVQMSSPSWQ
jgi:hypothetical protein